MRAGLAVGAPAIALALSLHRYLALRGTSGLATVIHLPWPHLAPGLSPCRIAWPHLVPGLSGLLLSLVLAGRRHLGTAGERLI